MRLVTFLFFLAILIYISFLGSEIKCIKNIALDEIDFGNALEEMFNSTRQKFKKRRILLLVVLLLGFLVIIGSQIYVQIGILFLL